MSATNWGICPVCKNNADKAQADLKQRAEDSYGKVSPEEYRKLYNQANPTVVNIQFTLREDYEIGIYNGNEFKVRYDANCTECGFSHTYIHKETINPKASKIGTLIWNPL